MVTRAVLRYVRITPRKFRLIIPFMKGKRPEDAIATLASVKKGASKYGIDLINSALSNAKRMQGVNVAELYVSKVIANGGPTLKRFRAGSMGRASMIKKRTSHITVELDVLAPKAGQEAKEAKAETKHLKTQPVQSVKMGVKTKAEKPHPVKKGKAKEEVHKKGKE